jgi:hypothetical protein
MTDIKTEGDSQAMNFMPPDPEKVMEALARLKDVFQQAADDSRGAAKPLFEKLSDTFNRTIDKTMDIAQKQQGAPDMRSVMMSLTPALIEFQSTVTKIQKLARTDADAAESLRIMEAAFRQEIESLLGGNFGGPAPSLPPVTSKPPAPPRTPAIKIIRPKKPDEGDFDL